MRPENIRLLHLIKSLDLGGIEKSTILYSNHFQKKLDFIGIYASKGFYDDSDFINKKINRFFPPHPIWQKKYFIKNLIEIISIIRENRISHLHYHHRIFIFFVFFIKCFVPKIKIIYTHHNVFNDNINKFIICNKAIALNKVSRNDLPKRLWTKTVIIPHGINVSAKMKHLSNAPKNIGYVGRFVSHKGLMKLIRAFKLVNHKIPNTKLIFVGKGPFLNKMFNEINKLKLNGSVLFKKPSISLNTIFSGLDILVLPSEKLEGFGIVLLEAMSFGIPVITFNADIFREIITDRVNGIICKSNTEIELANRITDIINDFGLYHKLLEGGYQTVIKKYDYRITLDQMLKLYLD